jgi:hypothetical protein
MQPEPAHRALAYIGRLYGVERAAQELADRTSQSTESLSGKSSCRKVRPPGD